jgi:hypothetical protein
MLQVMRQGIEKAKARGDDPGSSEWTADVMEQAPVTIFVFNNNPQYALLGTLTPASPSNDRRVCAVYWKQETKEYEQAEFFVPRCSLARSRPKRVWDDCHTNAH